MNKLLGTWFYVGLMPFAPGTWGSAAALPFAVLLHFFGGFPALATASMIVFCVGWWATAAYTQGAVNHDPGEIVIDEVAGQWVTLLPLSFLLWQHAPHVSMLPWPGLLGGFVLFRIFDIWKPWPVSWADKKSTPFGVMIDDILAGVYAGTILTLFGGLAHRGFG